MEREAYSRTIEELNNDSGSKRVIDLRKAEDYAKDTYPGAINLFWEDYAEEPAALYARICEEASGDAVYLLCYTGQKSKELIDDFAELEAFDPSQPLYSIEGGYRAYLREKLLRGADAASGNAASKSGADAAEADACAVNHYGLRTDYPVEDRSADIEKSIVKKFRKEIWCRFTRALREYELIKPGDRICVCISGGKDSMLMAKLFQELKRHGEQNFSLRFLVMNPGYNEVNFQRILDNAKILNIPIEVFETDIFDSVVHITDSPCYLCARMRRGHLYAKAEEMGCNKIALGHHFDDVIETILMGMLYGAQIQTMMPKLHGTNFEGMELIRPLYYVREESIKHWARYNRLEFIQCACRFTEGCASCGGTEKGSKRAFVKELIKTLKEDNPFIEKNIFRSVENVNLSTVIAYKQEGVKHHFLDTYDDVITPGSKGAKSESSLLE